MVTDEKQPAYEVLDYDTEGKSFRYLHHEVPISEEIAIHFHPELEINWIVRGYGMRIVGTCHEFFSQGEMVFMPGSMPHCWIYDPESCGDTGRKESHVCQLSANMLLHACIIFPELKPVVNFLLSLHQAYMITGNSKAVVCQQLLAMEHADDAMRLCHLWSVLTYISHHPEDLLPIGKPEDTTFEMNQSIEQMRKLLDYISLHYKEEIRLNDIAQHLNLSTASFCRCVKQATGQTFIAYLNNYRLNKFCELLQSDTTQRINELAWACGFSDIPYFNRLFKKVKGMTPSAWIAESRKCVETKS